MTVQTDSVRNIPCGTSGGVMVSFAKIEVVNRLHKDFALDTIRNYTVHYDRPLIFDKVHHLINQHCSAHTLREVYIDLFDTLDEMLQADLQAEADKWAPGVEIIAVRVTKPVIPPSIRDNFERMEAEKTKLLIATEVQRVREKEAETEKLVATIAAQRDANVSRVNMQREIEEKEAARKLAGIEDTMHVARERALADAEHYKALKDADSNAQRLTPAYLEFQRIQSMGNVKKVYFGKELPDMFASKGEGAHAAQANAVAAGDLRSTRTESASASVGADGSTNM